MARPAALEGITNPILLQRATHAHKFGNDERVTYFRRLDEMMREGGYKTIAGAAKAMVRASRAAAAEAREASWLRVGVMAVAGADGQTDRGAAHDPRARGGARAWDVRPVSEPLAHLRRMAQRQYQDTIPLDVLLLSGEINDAQHRAGRLFGALYRSVWRSRSLVARLPVAPPDNDILAERAEVERETQGGAARVLGIAEVLEHDDADRARDLREALAVLVDRQVEVVVDVCARNGWPRSPRYREALIAGLASLCRHFGVKQ